MLTKMLSEVGLYEARKEIQQDDFTWEMSEGIRLATEELDFQFNPIGMELGEPIYPSKQKTLDELWIRLHYSVERLIDWEQASQMPDGKALQNFLIQEAKQISIKLIKEFNEDELYIDWIPF